jgi:hypothetical protein
MTAALYRRHPDAMADHIGDDVVALQRQSGKAYGMQDVTAALWRWLDDPATLDMLVARATDAYDVEPGTARVEIAALLNRMEQAGLVVADR